MNKNKRHSVFETNSSSSHSISIKDTQGLLSTISLNSKGDLILNGGEYGWEWIKSNDALTKANYCAVFTMYYPDYRDMLTKILQEQTGAIEVIYRFTDDWDDQYFAYIDHQSRDVAVSAFEDESTLRNFIFNSNSWLFLGNDNDDKDNFYEE